MTPGEVRALNRPVLLRIQGVAKPFGEMEAVRSLDLELRAGEYFCILSEGAMDHLHFIEDVGADRRLFEEIWARLKAWAGRSHPEV